MIRTSETLI
jgi:hypothetical protein